MPYTDSVLELTGVTKSYGDQVVLDELDLTVGGGVFALLGPNGAGKTTMINILSTLVRPDAGTARVLGHDVVRERGAVQQLIGVTGQYAAVDEVLTGTENLIMMGRLVGLSTARARSRAGELLEQFDLVDAQRRQVKTYSGGMRRRLDLAVSLIRAPRVIFLDEPTTGLDTRSRQALWDEVRALSVRETTIVLTTQYLDEADALADRVGVLHRGRIVADGSPSALKAEVGGDVIEVLDEHGRAATELSTTGTAADIATILAGLPADTRIQVRRPSMNEVFLSLTATEAETESHSEEVAA